MMGRHCCSAPFSQAANQRMTTRLNKRAGHAPKNSGLQFNVSVPMLAKLCESWSLSLRALFCSKLRDGMFQAPGSGLDAQAPCSAPQNVHTTAVQLSRLSNSDGAAVQTCMARPCLHLREAETKRRRRLACLTRLNSRCWQLWFYVVRRACLVTPAVRTPSHTVHLQPRART